VAIQYLLTAEAGGRLDSDTAHMASFNNRSIVTCATTCCDVYMSHWESFVQRLENIMLRVSVVRDVT